MATNNGFVMVEHANAQNNNNNFEMVEAPEELKKQRRVKKMAKKWKTKAKSKAKAKQKTRIRRMTNTWRAKATRSARNRTKPLSRKPRTAFVGPKGKKNTKLSKTFLKKRANQKRGVVAPRAPRDPIRRASFSEFKVPVVREKLRAKGQNLRFYSVAHARASGPVPTPKNVHQPSKGKL